MPQFATLGLVAVLYLLAGFSARAQAAAPGTAADAGKGTGTAATLEQLEARVPKPGPDGAQAAMQVMDDALRLIDTGTLTSGDQLWRASRLISVSDNRFRADRVRYELVVAAAALGQADAEKQIAAAWDQLMAALGRPYRADFGGFAQGHAEYVDFEPAPGGVLAVLRDPAAAREAAKTVAANAEIKRIVDADQADRRADWSKLTREDMEAIGTRDRERNDRTLAILNAGGLHTHADFANAALVMQHSSKFAGYRTAHELALCSMLLGDRSIGRWLIAATYDRMLGSVGHDQRFGTQYHTIAGTTVIATVDTAGICDAERKALGCPTLEEARNRSRQ